MLLLFVLNWLP